MSDTGSALLDEIMAKRRELDKIFRRPPPASTNIQVTLPPVKLPKVRLEPQKPVAWRVAEAMKLRGTISELELQTIVNAIYGSARDCGDNSLDPTISECSPEQLVPGVPSTMSIQFSVSTHFNLTMDELLSRRRRRGVVIARQIAMYLCRIVAKRSHCDISRRFGDRDHTTVIHAVRKITRLMAEDPMFAEEIEALKAMVMG